MQNYSSNQLTNNTNLSMKDVVKKASQLKQNQYQQNYENVKQYVQSTPQNQYSGSIVENAKKLKEQSAKSYIQQMNSKIGMQ
ncbi:hypothetical protein JYG23_14135 [Sedimentibacter sp. zth1]|uniref:hypothetical protein n=1 Tax=Sedimentibacter sp. zth1 TaxID=2816908 RepID=UPI001A9166D1|nr:hypothetical protein [Sedimentibacter sp. zth1]QSX05784.1 hypothetical protein JYG23_14135 [Sedimentibacter sp. zth1]